MHSQSIGRAHELQLCARDACRGYSKCRWVRSWNASEQSSRRSAQERAGGGQPLKLKAGRSVRSDQCVQGSLQARMPLSESHAVPATTSCSLQAQRGIEHLQQSPEILLICTDGERRGNVLGLSSDRKCCSDFRNFARQNCIAVARVWTHRLLSGHAAAATEPPAASRGGGPPVTWSASRPRPAGLCCPHRLRPRAASPTSPPLLWRPGPPATHLALC